MWPMFKNQWSKIESVNKKQKRKKNEELNKQ